MNNFERIVQWISSLFDRIAQWALAVTMVLLVANMLLRVVWRPIPGTYEISGYLGAVVIGFALAWCGVKGRHIAITVLTDRFPKRVNIITGVIIDILSFAFFILAAWQCYRLGTSMLQSGELSPDLRFPFYPLVYGVGLVCLLLGLVYLVNVIKSITLESK